MAATVSHTLDPVETRFKQMPVGVPDYDKFKISSIITGKQGSAPGELYSPRGVAVDEATHQIFVANYNNNRVEIFSETGEFICQLGAGQLTCPYGIAIHGDSVYVSCLDDSVIRFSLTEMCLVKKIGGYGSNNGQFKYPRQLTTDPIGRVFIADSDNHRISIHDPDLNHLRSITHQSMLRPYGVKVSRDRLYVICPDGNPHMHVLTQEGDKLHSLITLEVRMGLQYPWFFCLDPLNNFVISYCESPSIHVFSPEGNLLHTIGRVGHQPRKFYGVAITPNGRLVCVSRNEKYCLQIYC